jgi:hypothetical protein
MIPLQDRQRIISPASAGAQTGSAMPLFVHPGQRWLTSFQIAK